MLSKSASGAMLRNKPVANTAFVAMVDCRHNFVSRGMRSYFLWILAGLYFLNALLYFRYFNATEPTSCAVDGSVSLVHWSGMLHHAWFPFAQ
jgi:hypothetical protein